MSERGPLVPMAPPAPVISPSMPPRGMTWPMVAYAFVRELPSTLMVLGGIIVAVVLACRAEPSMLHVLGAAVLPAVVAALQRSKPAEAIDVTRLMDSPGPWQGPYRSG